MLHRSAVFVLLAAPLLAAGQTPEPAAGIALELAQRRAALIRELRYELELSVPLAADAPLTGTNTLRFALADAGQPLVIDFAPGREQLRRVDANGQSAFSYTNGHIVVPAASLRQGENTIAIEFAAGDASLNRNPDFLYTLFVPARAHLALPLFDQPDLKAKWSLALELPAAWQALSNGAELSREPSGEGEPGGGAPPARARVRFAQTAPLPPYLFSFVAGEFRVQSAQRGGRTLRMFHRETDATKLARNREALFDLHAGALQFMERYTAIPYPFAKFDFALIPALQFGGMEHAGAIVYNAANLLLDESATQNQKLGRASVIAHETAHMWFGDLVTMRWFDDVWMKEVFANFMAAKIVNPAFPEVNHELRFLLAHYPAAYAVDRTPGANPIRQPLENLRDAGSLYGAIIYQKAPIAMRHLEQRIGADSFRDGLREYLSAHAFGNASWSDLISVLDRRTPDDLQAWSRAWIEEPGRPAIRTELELADGAIARLGFAQSDPAQRGRRWPQELRVLLGYADKSVPLRVRLEAERADVPGAAGLPAPLYVLPVAEGWAYGGFALDEASLRQLAGRPPSESLADPVSRGALWVALWDALLERALSAAAFVDLALASLPLERDEQLTQRVLTYLGNAWWRFLPEPERSARRARLEAALREGLATAQSASQKAAWFAALAETASTPETLAWLRRIWAQQEQIAGLPLAEADYTSLALELAVREVANWREILAAQLARIDNPDRRARFAFVMPALSADTAERERWFRQLADVANRRREPWVLEGLRFLHHPLRAADSARYVQSSLELLREIQSTGDIFFPLRWSAATLGGHSSPAVAATVRAFLDGLPPDYPPRLRNILLQSADELFRAAGAQG